MQSRSIGMLALGHLCVDIMQGALPALIPFLITAHHLNLAAAGGLIFASSVASSIVQPIFGHFADRLAKPWLMPLGLIISGISMSLIGLMQSYWAMVITVAICGLGVAAFHPEGARLVNAVSGRNKATAMSLFSIGGNAGFALGPLLTTGAQLLFGLKGTLFLALPNLIVASLLAFLLPQFINTRPDTASQVSGTTSVTTPDAWKPFAYLSIAVIMRSVVFYAIMTFIPMYWVDILHKSKGTGSTMLTVFITCGVIGTLIGGRLADRYGYLTIIRTSFVLLLPLLFLLARFTNIYSATALLIPLGLLYYAPFSTMVVLGQRYLPNHVGLASGVTLGLAVSIGGAMAPVMGRFADHYGIPTVLRNYLKTYVCAIMGS